MNQLSKFFGRLISEGRKRSSERWQNFWPEFAVNLVVGLMLATAFWQWRHTFYFAEVSGGYFEYGSLHLYVADILALIVVAWLTYRGELAKLQATNIPRRVVLAGTIAMAWMTASALWSINPMVALWRAGELWLWAMIAVWLATGGLSLAKALKSLMAGAVISAGVGMGEFLTNRDLGLQMIGESPLEAATLGVPVVIDNGERQLRAHGLTPHPNILGGVLAMVIAYLIVWQEWVRAKLRPWVLIAPVLLMGLAWSFSRGPMLALMLVLMVAGIIIFRRPAHRPHQLITILGIVLIILLVVQANLWMGRVNPADFDQLEKRSVAERLISIEEWKGVFAQHEVLGVGLANYPIVMAKLHPTSAVWEIQPVHNVGLLMAGEVGLVGIGLLIWVIWEITKYWWTKYRMVGERLILRSLPLVAWGIVGLFDHWPASLHQGYVGLFLALALLFWREDV